MNVEWLILADAAEVTGGKLYLLGGGWDTLTINSAFPVVQPMAVAFAIEVPWNETNQKQRVQFEIADQDMNASLAQGEVEFEVGRPPGRPIGQAQRVQFAFKIAIELPHGGVYTVAVRGAALDERRITFNVVPSPMLQMQQRGQEAR
jgi:hypothetical protein